MNELLVLAVLLVFASDRAEDRLREAEVLARSTDGFTL